MRWINFSLFFLCNIFTCNVSLNFHSGFRPTRRSVIGEPRIPGHEKQVIIRRESFSSRDLEEYGAEVTKSPAESNATLHQFRAFAKHMDILERYNTATQQILERGQTQEQLLSIVRTKMDERALTQAMLQIRTRKLFECFDVNGDGYLDEKEFRFCLEMLNIQYDDVQSLALFAFFDYNNDGFIDWSEFAHHVLRYHK